MDRRHQVFVSSTFTDLKQERAEIIQALLELDCFPAGMELFPATHDGAWELIRKVIDDSDYYCLVVGARYGSLDSDGLSYTEKEYDYAVATGKPVVAFLHSQPETISFDKSEPSVEIREKLEQFRTKVKTNHHCKFWSNADDLGGKVSRAMINLRKSHPSDGWVPGSFAEDESSRIEKANLKTRVAELEASLARSSEISHDEIEDMASGDDLYYGTVAFGLKDQEDTYAEIPITWDQILRYIGPTLLNECTDEQLEEKFKLCYYHALQSIHPSDTVDFAKVIVPYVTADQIKIQLRALGHMTPGTKRRAVADRRTYWKLGSAGESRLISVQALRKTDKQKELDLEVAAPGVAP